MPILVWDESFSVRIAKVDQQHKQLFSLINQLHDAMAEGKGKETLDKVFSGMLNYTVTHFKEEEQMLSAHGYPQFAAHKKQHEAFIERFTQLQKDHNSGKLGVSIQTRDLLKTWWETHIKTIDMQYSSFLIQKGIH
jgi:hemerythrin